MAEPKTYTHEDSVKERYNKNTYKIQPCPRCGLNHDYDFKGRTIECICGAKLRTGSKGLVIVW